MSEKTINIIGNASGLMLGMGVLANILSISSRKKAIKKPLYFAGITLISLSLIGLSCSIINEIKKG